MVRLFWLYNAFVFPRPYITTALVTSRLDYCEFIFHNIAFKDITKLRVQNCLARIVTRSPRFTHSMSLLRSLH